MFIVTDLKGRVIGECSTLNVALNNLEEEGAIGTNIQRKVAAEAFCDGATTMQVGHYKLEYVKG